jgi:hypothetical protein
MRKERLKGDDMSKRLARLDRKKRKRNAKRKKIGLKLKQGGLPK